MVLNLKSLPGAPDAPERAVQWFSLLVSVWFVLRAASQSLRVSPGFLQVSICFKNFNTRVALR